jgi:hypothetical protein
MAARRRTLPRLGRSAVNADSSSDAWFLAAAYGAGRKGARLADILSESDYINHAIIAPMEIEHAVRRLVSGGLLAVEGPDTFRVTSDGRALVQRAQRGLRFWPEILKRMGVAIDAAVSADPAEQVGGWTLDPRLYEAASDRYRTKFDEEMRRYEGLPNPLRNVLKILWWVVIRLSQLFRR